MNIESAFLPSLLHNFCTTLSKPSLFDLTTFWPFASVRIISLSTSTISGCADPNVSFHAEKNLARHRRERSAPRVLVRLCASGPMRWRHGPEHVARLLTTWTILGDNHTPVLRFGVQTKRELKLKRDAF